MTFNFLCFDTEDDSKELMDAGKSGFDKVCTQIAAITAEGKRYYNTGDTKDFLRWLEQQPERFIYALNLQYDLGNLFSKKLDCLDCTFVGGRLIKAVWGTKIFVDVFNIWPMSVKKLGVAFGLHKLETSDMSNDVAYVYRDAEIIREAMLFAWGFCEPMGIKNLPPTLGGLCVKVWQAGGGANVHDSNELSREALYGGRVELFKVGNESEHIAWVDINSLYPFVMQNKFPGICAEWEGDNLPGYGVAKITIESPKTELGLLPFRDDEGRILYPYGTLTGTWTIPEINNALEYGATITKIHQAYGTNDYIIPYGTFVNHLYQARLISESSAEKLFFKLLMNNLYGRLGTSGEIWRTIWQTPKNKLEGIPYGDRVLIKYKMPLSEETNWMHAAYITAYGRLELLKYIRLIGAANMIYCDTDSCIFDVPGWNDKKPKANFAFETGKKLGQMKICQRCSVCHGEFPHDKECPDSQGIDFWEQCQTFAPKMYRIDGIAKAKGVPKRLAKEYITAGRAEYDLPFKMREAIRFYDRSNKRELSVWRKVSKQNQAEYTKKTLKNNRYFPGLLNGENVS